jgi:hypothetical protein
MSTAEDDRPVHIDDRAADVIGDAIAQAVRRAVDEVGRAPLAELGASDGPVPEPSPVYVTGEGDAHATDPYEVLGVARSAPWDQIVAAHKRLARQWHPDAGGDEEKIRRLNAAYAELRVRRGR